MRARRTFGLGLATAVCALAAATALPSAASGFRAGFDAEAITPVGAAPSGWSFVPQPTTGVWGEAFTDLNANGCHDENEPFLDDPANTLIDPQSAGRWDGIWTNAGFTGRCAKGKYDDTWARAVVLSDGFRTVAMVSLDVVGFFNEEILRAKAELAAERPDIALDAFVVSSTHTHEGPDTMGLWGAPPGYVRDGKYPIYQAFVRDRLVEAIADAYDALEPAEVKFARATHTVGVRDSRNPDVKDPDLWAAQFVRPGSGTTIGTVVNWSNHPEALSSGNQWISSDFPHGARQRLESVLGGTAVYFSGAVGGLMTPLGTNIPGYGTSATYGRMLEIGKLVADAAIGALSGATAVVNPPIAAAHKEFTIPIDNQFLRLLNSVGTFDKPAYTAGVPTGTSGQDLKTEMYAVSVGPAVFVTVPGELFPELSLGGYGRTDCATASTGRPYEPVIRTQFASATYTFVLGLGQDELGYIVPGYDFWMFGAPPYGTGPSNPTNNDPEPFVALGGLEAQDPCGEGHYEETVSASSVMAPLVACTAAELAGKDPWSDATAFPGCTEANTTVGPLGTHPAELLD